MAQPAEPHEQLNAAPAKPATPEQARWKGARDSNGRPMGAILNGRVVKDTAAAMAEFARLYGMRVERSTTQPRRVRGRAPRMATNARTRGSRRSSPASRGSPSDDPEPPPSVGPRRVVA
jgi:hypothetical protein